MEYVSSVTKMPYDFNSNEYNMRETSATKSSTADTLKKLLTLISKTTTPKPTTTTVTTTTSTSTTTTTTTTSTTSTRSMEVILPQKQLANRTDFNDKNPSDKLNTILLAYKSSRNENEDQVEEWLKSLNVQTLKKVDMSTSRPSTVSKQTSTTTTKRTITTEVSTTTKKKLNIKKKFPRKNSKKKQKTTVDETNLCEERNDGDFIRDPSDCASFFTCYMGKSSMKTSCGAGLLFDLSCNCCNWPAQVRIKFINFFIFIYFYLNPLNKGPVLKNSFKSRFSFSSILQLLKF